MIIVPFKAEHIFLMKAQDAQKIEAGEVTLDEAKQMEDMASYTAMQDGLIIGCGGVFPFHNNRALCWSYLSTAAGAYFIPLHRKVKTFLETLEYNRLEMDVACDFAQGHRWAKLLGFQCETPRMEKYFTFGGDAAKYVRIR